MISLHNFANRYSFKTKFWDFKIIQQDNAVTLQTQASTTKLDLFAEFIRKLF